MALDNHGNTEMTSTRHPPAPADAPPELGLDHRALALRMNEVGRHKKDFTAGDSDRREALTGLGRPTHLEAKVFCQA